MSLRRRKSLLFILAAASCFIFYNWFYQPDAFQTQDQNAQQNLRIDLNDVKPANVLYADFNVKIHEKNLNKDQNSGHHNRRDTEYAHGDKKASQEADYVKLNVISEQDFNHVSNTLYNHKAFLLDVDVLNRIFFINKHLETLESPKDVKAYKLNILESFASQKQNDKKTPLITYGIFLESLADLNDAVQANTYLSRCNKQEMKDTFRDNQVLTSIYLDCGSLVIQISVVYSRAKYLWIGPDSYKSSQLGQRFFGDTPRALQTFGLSVVHDERSNVFSVPENIKKFLFDYDHSKFIECNRTLANNNVKLMGANYTQNPKRNKMISGVITHLSESLESFYKHYWLAGGTLLGWYRDCGIIPHTQDVDIAIWAHEYENKIKKHFLGNKIVRVWGTLGIKNDSYEFRLYNDQFTFDMFLVYKLNLTHQWCGYQVNRVKFRRFLPNFDELCSAELLDHKFMIPCDPVSYLNKEYGPGRWLTPQAKNYTWTNVVYMQNWTDTLWPHTIKYYDKEGKPINSKILKYVNTHLHPSKQIIEVPADDLE